MVGPSPMAPFDLADEGAYGTWRAAKLADYPTSARDLMVSVADSTALGDGEIAALLARIRKTNMALYRAAPSAEATARLSVSALATRLGLLGMEGNLCADEDGITPLQVDARGARGRYIPYTDKPLNWHTDGYYNTADRRLHAMTLHCVRAAPDGGENGLMDPEIAYILLRDENPAFIGALMHPGAMTIPANEIEDGDPRPEMVGPVFDVEADGTLYMRYSARKRNIVWRDDPLTIEAVTFLNDVMNSPSPYIFRHTLAPGEGLISNNVLHMRTGFDDGTGSETKRLILRGRFYERIDKTAYRDIYAS